MIYIDFAIFVITNSDVANFAKVKTIQVNESLSKSKNYKGNCKFLI